MPSGGKRAGAGRKPGAVSQSKRELAELAKDHAEAALNTLVAIHKNNGQPASARVSAAVAILDRAYGKPPQAIVGDPDAPLMVGLPDSREAAKAVLAILTGAVSATDTPETGSE